MVLTANLIDPAELELKTTQMLGDAAARFAPSHGVT